MAMSWIERAASCEWSDSRDLLDALEDPAHRLAQELQDAEIELECRRGLLLAFGDEERQQRAARAEREERLGLLDADMHLALARDDEPRARQAILRIIPIRREIVLLDARIERLARERARLALAVERARDDVALAGRRLEALHRSRSPQRAPGHPELLPPSGAPDSPRRWIPRLLEREPEPEPL